MEGNHDMTNERMLERGRNAARGRGRKASVDVVPVSEETEFMINAAARGMRPETAPIEGERDGATEGGMVTRLKGGVNDTVTMYKETPSGWMPRRVAAGSIAMNLANGYKIRCPQCDGQHGGDPNECSGRDPIAVRICPVCGKRIYDNRVVKDVDLEVDDPNVIQDDAYKGSTPAIRTKAALDWHIWNRHPQEAREMGLASLPEAPRLAVPEVLQGSGVAAVMGAGIGT